MAKKIILWGVFNVTIALLPFGFRMLATALRGDPMNFGRVFGDGELLLVSAAIAAGAVGEVVTSQLAWVVPKTIIAGGCVISLIMSCLLYAHISAVGPATLNAQLVCQCSLITLFLTFAVGFCAVVLSET